jgi:hypothetical protein
LPKRLSILRPAFLLLLCLAFLTLYVDSASRSLQKVPPFRYWTKDLYFIGLQRAWVAGHGPYSAIGATPPNFNPQNVFHHRGVGWAVRLDRRYGPDGTPGNLFWFVRIPHWFFAAAFAATSILSLRKHLRLQRMWARHEKGLCPYCGYDLRASSGTCPECGKPTPQPVPAA